MDNIKELIIIKKYLFIFILFVTVLTGCSVSNDDPQEEYIGEELRIGIIGTAPEIRETQIEFDEIGFDKFSEDDFDSQYDAIFITKENLSKASNAEYASIYRNSDIPIYFIENEKFDINFIEEDLTYEEVPYSKDGMYINGILYKKEMGWGYGLYNDIKSEINIKGVYSRVFEDISEIKNNELP